MTDSTREQLLDGLRHFAAIVGWLAGGAVLGIALARWLAPGSDAALIASALMFPATIVLGWMLMFPLALLLLPFMIPRFIRWLREPLPKEAPPAARRREASAAGWLFVLAAVPTSLVAGIIAGAPCWYLLAGLLYGYGLRHSASVQDVTLE